MGNVAMEVTVSHDSCPHLPTSPLALLMEQLMWRVIITCCQSYTVVKLILELCELPSRAKVFKVCEPELSCEVRERSLLGTAISFTALISAILVRPYFMHCSQRLGNDFIHNFLHHSLHLCLRGLPGTSGSENMAFLLSLIHKDVKVCNMALFSMLPP